LTLSSPPSSHLTTAFSLQPPRQDEDNLCIMNAMSQPAQAASLAFYILPCSWMEACLPFLTGRTEQKPTEKILNAPLFVTSETSDEGGKTEATFDALRKADQKLLRRDIVHAQDFFLVGCNAWTLLSSKFGFDIELRLKVTTHVSTRTDDSNLAVNLGHQKIVIPATGRFDYVVMSTDAVSEDEDFHDLVSCAHSPPPSCNVRCR
jgi:hypothetical protein